MRFAKSFAWAALAGLVYCASGARDARACAVLTPDETTPVAGHRMVLSVSKDKTTLWDQFRYSGAPESFAWVLPTKGEVEVGLSSDALFETLGQVTAPQIFAASVCPNSCDGQGGGSTGGGFNGVDVIAHEVVGPYETVQLSSKDPESLKKWLADNGYPIPDDVAPLLDAYVTEGFDFLALRLIPGAGLDAVRPVRVTMSGAMPSVPIRLLAAGTGEITQVTLWVVADGRVEPSNAPVVTIDPSELTWDFDKDASDYGEVKTKKLEASEGLAYLVEQARPVSTFQVTEPLAQFVEADPAASGYGTPEEEPLDGLDADLAALFEGLGDTPWIMRFTADLSRKALAQDLLLQSAADQSSIDGVYYTTDYVGDPNCPPDPCGGEGGGSGEGGSGEGGSGGSGSGSGAGGGGAAGGGGPGGPGNQADSGGEESDAGGCGCRVAGEGNTREGALAALGAAAALAALSRKRRTRA